jgi:hypothetical protein
MAVNLSSTNSLVDYLNIKGKDSSPEARKKLWTDLGLEARNGAYTRTGQQNTNLLNALRQQDITPFVPGNSPLKLPETPVATNAVNIASQPVAQPAIQQAQTTTPSPVQAPTPTTATDTMGTLGYTPPAPMKPEDVMAGVAASPEYKLGQEEQGVKDLIARSTAEAQKHTLQTEYETEVDKIENDLELSFSGRRGQVLQDLTTNLASSMLATDRELAGKLLESDVNARTKFLGIANDVIKDANENDKSALDQLNKAGYAMVGGKLMPTAEALRLAQTAGTAEFNQMIQIERLKISAQNAATSQERNSILNQMRMVNLQKSTQVSPGQVVNRATGLPIDLTQGESEMLSRQQTVKDYYIPTMLDTLTGIETGSVTGKVNKYTAKMPVVQYMRNEDLSMFNAMASYMSQQIVYMNSGKQINEAEMKILQQSLPSAELTTEENRKRLNQFEEITGQTLDRLLNLNGWTISEPNDAINNVINQEAGATDDFEEIDDFLNSF